MATKKISELEPLERVRLYGTVVTILTTPYHSYKMADGWLRVPMEWGGIRCAPPEHQDTEVEVVEDEDDIGA